MSRFTWIPYDSNPGYSLKSDTFTYSSTTAPVDPAVIDATLSNRHMSLYAAYTAAPVTVFQNISYTYDAVGNITAITDRSDSGSGKAVTYQYDDLDRLTSAATTAASSTPYTQTYTYSTLGNITYKSDVGTSTYAGTNYANPYAPTSVGGKTLTYDNNGNLTAYGANTYTWNYRNQLTQVGTSTPTTSGTTTYGYDHTGSRVHTIVANATTTYPNRLFSTTNATTTKHIFAGNTLIGTVETPVAITLATTTKNISTAYVPTSATKTWSHTVAGANPVIVLSAAIFQDVGGVGEITSATWGGASFTKVTSTRMGTKSAEMWYLVATTTGTYTLSVTITGTTNAIKLSAATFNGVHQTSPLDAYNTNTGSSGNPSVSVTTATANDVVVATLHRHSTTAATTNRTSLYNDSVTSTLGAASYQLATSTGSYSDTYTGSANHNWAIIAAGFKPAATGNATTYIVHPDHLDGTHVVTDNNGDLAQTLDYYPFGSLRMDEQQAGFNEKRKFTGHEYDVEVGLTYMRARYQDGGRGQFLSQDPVFRELGLTQEGRAALLDPQLQNSYSYARTGIEQV